MKIESVEAYSVHKNDEVCVSLGWSKRLEHVPSIKDRGPVVAVYAVALLDDGHRTFGIGLHPCDTLNGCDVGVAKTAAIKDLVRFVEEQSQFQSILPADSEIDKEYVTSRLKEPGESKKGPTWPKWNEEMQCWIDADDVVYNKDVHASYRGDKPSVNKDGTFRMKRAPKKAAKDIRLVSKPGEV